MKVQIDEKEDLYRYNNLSAVKIMKKGISRLLILIYSIFLKFSGKVYGKFEIEKTTTLKIVKLGLKLNTYLL